MQFFWLSSFTANQALPPAEWPQIRMVGSLEEIPDQNSAIILEIACQADSERAVNILEQRVRSIPVWILDPAATVSSSVAWIKYGASQVALSLDDPELTMELFDAHNGSSANVRDLLDPECNAVRSVSTNMIGDSRSMRDVQAAIRMVGDRNCNVLIEGETGTGKEVVAREIHSAGNRSRGPWVAVNCSAIPEPLLEAELFGYLKGAFTGAQQSRAGKFEAANNGTIFLDEIGDMPIGVQAKLLRVLQEREIERLGGNERIRLNIRVIAATNVDLAARVKEGRFRQDLFYRLNVFQISLPALRDRPDDVAALARHFVKKICTNERIPIKMLDRSALDRLRAQNWPGNVRELENTIETAVIMSRERAVIFASDLRFVRSAVPVTERAQNTSLPAEGMDYQRALEDFEVGLLRQALTRVRGNKTAAADLLGLKRTTLAAKMKALEARFPLLAA